ncbi:hypothetical protein B7486_53260, partial [cyanobacterium TDX16]
MAPPPGAGAVQHVQPAVHDVQRRPVLCHPLAARRPPAAAQRLRRRLLRAGGAVPRPRRGDQLPGRRTVPRHGDV